MRSEMRGRKCIGIVATDASYIHHYSTRICTAISAAFPARGRQRRDTSNSLQDTLHVVMDLAHRRTRSCGGGRTVQ